MEEQYRQSCDLTESFEQLQIALPPSIKPWVGYR